MSGDADELGDLHALADATADGGAMPAAAAPSEQSDLLSETELDMLDPGAETPGLTEAEIDTILSDLDIETPATLAASAAAKWPRRMRTEEGKQRRRDADAARKAKARAEARLTNSQVPAPAPYAALAGRMLSAQERAKKEAVARHSQLMLAFDEPNSDKVLGALKGADKAQLNMLIRTWLIRELLRAKTQCEPSREKIAAHVPDLRGRTSASQRVIVGRRLERAEHLEKIGVWSQFSIVG